MYKRAFEAYQESDKSKLMFFEPSEFPDEMGIFGGFVFNLGFTEAPGGADKKDLHVLNDHTYCCQLDPSICATGEPALDKAQTCYDWHEKRIGTRSEDAMRLGIPLIISEFGACLNSTACVQEINSVGDVCDNHLVGWAYWQFKNFADLTTSAGTGSEGFYNNDGSLQNDKVKALARTYLPVTQGQLKYQNFNTKTAEFNARFVVDTSITEPTVIFWSQEFWYPQGFGMRLTDSNGKKLILDTDYSFNQHQGNYAKLLITNPSLNGQELSMNLIAKYIRLEEILE